jgi:glyceraldehyde 3-phosphate dehydrogenase
MRVAINGFGRIGRAAFKIILENPSLKLVAVNDLAPVANLAYLLKFDTVYGRYERYVDHDDGHLIVDRKPYRVFAERDPARLPWGDLEVDLVLECTGAFRHKEDLERHIRAGARYVILSAPARDDEMPTVVHGVNAPDGSTRIISCASCTTNCIAPVVEVMGRRIGIKKAAMTTVHAYTSTQGLVDGPKKDFRRGRAGAANLVPTSTGAALATTTDSSPAKETLGPFRS